MSEAGVNVKVEERRDGRVARVTVDNAGKLNCLSTPLIVAMTEAFAKLGEDRSLRAVVLTGAGDCAFIGGADLNELGGLCADSARLFITRLHVACKAIRDCPLPVIGRINGFVSAPASRWRPAATCARPRTARASACPRCTWGCRR